MIQIEVPESPPHFKPRQTIVGTLRWERAKPFEEIQLHLLWYTSGIGDTDGNTVETLTWKHLGTSGERHFEIVLPRAPYSIQSENLGIHWKLEAEGKPGKDLCELEIVISPQAEVIHLASIRK